MKPTLVLVAAASLGLIAIADAAEKKSARNPDGCKVVQLEPGESAPSGTLSSSVTAGGGHVSAQTSGGNSVTVHSGNGSTSSAVTTGSSGANSTTVTSANGDCTVYVTPRAKK